MNKEDLKKLVIEFKRSLGYLDRPTNNQNAILFTKGEIEELIYIYDKKEGEDPSQSLIELARTYKRIPEKIGRIFLATTPLGRPPEAVQENGFTYQVPVWFFDKEFSEIKDKTPLKTLEAEAKKYENERIAQPFTCDGQKGNDLLETILKELEHPTQGWIRIILAPAGYGKTVLMSSLYSKLKEKFIKDKQAQRLSMRPIIMLPGHIGRASNLNGLINNFINSEYTFGDASVNTFKFWVNNNFVIWLLDGVEELFIKEPEECLHSLLDEYIISPNSIIGNPQIIIAIREQLLEIPELSRYIDEWKLCIKVYKLEKWGNNEIISYIDKNLSLGKEEKENFKKEVLNSPVLNSLCSVPYFCSLITDFKNRDELGSFNDEFELVEIAFEKYCDREFNKGLSRDFFPIDVQREIMIDIVGEQLKGNKETKEVLKSWVELYTGNCSEDLRSQQYNYFLRHALFLQTEKEIIISHEIMKQYLEGKYLLQKLNQNDLNVFNTKEIEYESFLLGFIVKHLSADIDWNVIMNKIIQNPCSSRDEAIGFRNILKILTKSKCVDVERIIKDHLSFKNLRGIKFKGMNMKGFKFQNSNLEGTTFEDCDLRNANFDGCIFKNTSFKNCLLEGATIKGIIPHSIEIDGRYIDDSKEIKRRLVQITKSSVEVQQEPCQALINLIEVLQKLTRKHKGFQMPKKFLLQTKCGGGVPAERIIEECVRKKVLIQEGDHIKINVNLYETIKSFVEFPSPDKLPQITQILDNLCPDTKIGCKHFYTGG